VPQSTVLHYVAEIAAKTPFVRKVVLFGSRAKGTARPFSDYDLAVKLDPDAPKLEWLAFKFRADENAPTLCELSLVEWTDTLRPELQDSIQREGIVIYEREEAVVDLGDVAGVDLLSAL
jgi:predicted nucleotidyltransferase